METTDDAALDNVVWHALGGPHAHFVETDPSGVARRYDREVSIFCAVETLDARAWDALAALAGPEGVAVLFRDEIPKPPAGWEEVYRDAGWQMVAGDLAPVPDLDVVVLDATHAPEMLALAQLTEPGPFLLRTHELGTYVGVFRDGRLLAMAGERMRIPGLTEISAVCTHPDAQRQGLAGALTLWMAREIRRRGEEAYLHVLAGNENALRLYRKLGFEVRRRVDVIAAQRS